jgi:protein archease
LPYEQLDDAPVADIGFTATGRTLDECFQSAADATLEAMVANPASLEQRERHSIAIDHEVLDLALLNFLQELVYYKDAHQLLLRASAVHVRRRDGGWRVEAVLEGERIDPHRHQLSADVKAVTMHRLRVAQTADGWEATVVLDV